MDIDGAGNKSPRTKESNEELLFFSVAQIISDGVHILSCRTDITIQYTSITTCSYCFLEYISHFMYSISLNKMYQFKLASASISQTECTYISLNCYVCAPVKNTVLSYTKLLRLVDSLEGKQF